MARLVCTQGNDAEAVFGLSDGVNRIGRSPEAHIKIFDKACSRAHAEIYRKADYIALEDLGSRHGTFLNGKRVTHRVKLHVGDRIDIGQTVLKLAEGEGTTIERAPQEVSAGQGKTQELSDRFLAAELDAVKQRQQRPRINLFQRLFGSTPPDK